MTYQSGADRSMARSIATDADACCRSKTFDSGPHRRVHAILNHAARHVKPLDCEHASAFEMPSARP